MMTARSRACVWAQALLRRGGTSMDTAPPYELEGGVIGNDEGSGNGPPP